MKRLQAWFRRCQRGWRGRVVSDENGMLHLTMLARVAHWPQRNWSAFDAPTHELKKPRVNVARMKIDRAKRVADMPVPAFLKRQAD